MPVRNCIAVGCTSDRRKNKDIRFVIQLPKVESALKKRLDLLRRDGVKCRPDLEDVWGAFFLGTSNQNIFSIPMTKSEANFFLGNNNF